MARAQNPYSGTYRPGAVRMNAAEFLKGIAGVKVKQPNRHMSETAYKKSLRKIPESQ